MITRIDAIPILRVLIRLEVTTTKNWLRNWGKQRILENLRKVAQALAHRRVRLCFVYCFMMFIVLYGFMIHISCFMIHVSCFMILVSCFFLPDSRFVSRARARLRPEPTREASSENWRGRVGASQLLFGSIFLIFGTTGEG